MLCIFLVNCNTYYIIICCWKTMPGSKLSEATHKWPRWPQEYQTLDCFTCTALRDNDYANSTTHLRYLHRHQYHGTHPNYSKLRTSHTPPDSAFTEHSVRVRRGLYTHCLEGYVTHYLGWDIIKLRYEQHSNVLLRQRVIIWYAYEGGLLSGVYRAPPRTHVGLYVASSPVSLPHSHIFGLGQRSNIHECGRETWDEARFIYHCIHTSLPQAI